MKYLKIHIFLYLLLIFPMLGEAHQFKMPEFEIRGCVVRLYACEEKILHKHKYIDAHNRLFAVEVDALPVDERMYSVPIFKDIKETRNEAVAYFDFILESLPRECNSNIIEEIDPYTQSTSYCMKEK